MSYAFAVFRLPGLEPVGRFRVVAGQFGSVEKPTASNSSPAISARVSPKVCSSPRTVTTGPRRKISSWFPGRQSGPRWESTNPRSVLDLPQETEGFAWG